MNHLNKKAVVIHSGGMDSSLCLKIAINKWGAENVLAIAFNYSQRHSDELLAAKKITIDWKVDQKIIDIPFLKTITKNSLVDHDLKIDYDKGVPNSLVLGRNGLMTRIASIHAQSLGASEVYTGVIEVEEANSGYRDCNRKYFDLLEKILRVDFGTEEFHILTPIVKMNKLETLELAKKLDCLEYLLEETITCYDGIKKFGCNKCPSCLLRNESIGQYLEKYKNLEITYKDNF